MLALGKLIRKVSCHLEEYVLDPMYRMARVAQSWTGWQRSEFSWDQTAALLKQMPAPGMPADLPARIRRHIAEQRRIPQPVPLSWRCKTFLKPLAVPASVGLLSAVFFFGIFVRIFEIPVHAGSGDIPLTVRTAPRLRRIALIEGPTGIRCMEVRLLVDRNGRVADFQVIKGDKTPEQLRQLEYLLVFTVFDPATVFGTPTPETVTLKLRDGYLKALSL